MNALYWVSSWHPVASTINSLRKAWISKADWSDTDEHCCSASTGWTDSRVSAATALTNRRIQFSSCDFVG